MKKRGNFGWHALWTTFGSQSSIFCITSFCNSRNPCSRVLPGSAIALPILALQAHSNSALCSGRVTHCTGWLRRWKYIRQKVLDCQELVVSQLGRRRLLQVGDAALRLSWSVCVVVAFLSTRIWCFFFCCWVDFATCHIIYNELFQDCEGRWSLWHWARCSACTHVQSLTSARGRAGVPHTPNEKPFIRIFRFGLHDYSW